MAQSMRVQPFTTSTKGVSSHRPMPSLCRRSLRVSAEPEVLTYPHKPAKCVSRASLHPKHSNSRPKKVCQEIEAHSRWPGLWSCGVKDRVCLPTLWGARERNTCRVSPSGNELMYVRTILIIAVDNDIISTVNPIC